MPETGLAPTPATIHGPGTSSGPHSGRSAIYVGTVVHKRLRPRRHALEQRVFALLLDVDDLPRLSAASRWFSYNRGNLIAIRDRDFGDGKGTLAEQARRLLAGAGLEEAGASILVLTYPRLFGYAFNPLTVFFCHDAEGRLAATIYEVSNTFGERRSYVLPVAGDGEAGLFFQETEKQLYVSPFNPLAGSYTFHGRAPGREVVVSVLYRSPDGPTMKAHFRGERRALTDRDLIGLALGWPFMTLGVIIGIHWHALRLWAKGLGVFSRTPAERFAVSQPGRTASDPQPRTSDAA